ncbi:MAG: hypothetical protein EBU88_06045 [Acidobacteria bacterium]|nr:hypothetical protein [Acidobacteriota bacterium]
MNNLRFIETLLLLTILAVTILGQKSDVRDHLTEQEVDLVRSNQEIDLRVEVFMKAADRRLLVLADPQAKQKKKEEEIWGPLPTGTALQLLQDYKRILEELEEKLDDALNRDSKNPALEKALKKAKDGAGSQIPRLKALGGRLSDRGEQRALLEAMEEAELISKANY